MNIFDPHASVVADYRDFVRSFFTVADERARAFVEQTLDTEARLWPDFLLQVSPSYDRVATVDDLAAAGKLHPETAQIFRTPESKPSGEHISSWQIDFNERAVFSRRRKTDFQ